VRAGRRGQRAAGVRPNPGTARPRVALANLTGSYLVTLLTLSAEIGGVALVLQLASTVSYLL
jgi:hypothetical protein